MGFLYSAPSSQRYIWVISSTSSLVLPILMWPLIFWKRCLHGVCFWPSLWDVIPLQTAEAHQDVTTHHGVLPSPLCWWGCVGERGGLTLPVHPRAHYAGFYTKQSRPTHTFPSRTSSCEMFWMGWKLRTCLPMLLEVLHLNCQLTGEHHKVPLPDPQWSGTSCCQPLLGKAENYFPSNLRAFCTGVSPQEPTVPTSSAVWFCVK